MILDILSGVIVLPLVVNKSFNTFNALSYSLRTSLKLLVIIYISPSIDDIYARGSW
ncbi:MAG: hypothetical protein QW615_00560 [Desulfurococcaceae archaeon]